MDLGAEQKEVFKGLGGVNESRFNPSVWDEGKKVGALTARSGDESRG